MENWTDPISIPFEPEVWIIGKEDGGRREVVPHIQGFGPCKKKNRIP